MLTHTPHGITQCYLPPGRGDIPALTPAEAGTRLSNPAGMEGCVDLVGLLHAEMVYPLSSNNAHDSTVSIIAHGKTVTHPGTNQARRALTSFMRRTPLTTTPRRDSGTVLFDLGWSVAPGLTPWPGHACRVLVAGAESTGLDKA